MPILLLTNRVTACRTRATSRNSRVCLSVLVAKGNTSPGDNTKTGSSLLRGPVNQSVMGYYTDALRAARIEEFVRTKKAGDAKRYRDSCVGARSAQSSCCTYRLILLMYIAAELLSILTPVPLTCALCSRSCFANATGLI